ncbi:MAG TPA: TIGR01212 family radical SAM protein [Spirochaetia bacterium]|nr:TIGR01212 family radical SAM protein [Spirochaetia bacterium]
MQEPPYRTYSRYLRERHGCAAYRVAVDAGFTCPNRSGGRAGPGCAYCSEDGSRAPHVQDGQSLEAQVRQSIRRLRARRSSAALILYFQAFSNTNAPVERLRALYERGLEVDEFRGLNVATRPDCIDEAKADLLADFQRRGLDVWVELGLQSGHDETLRRIDRGHTVQQFRDACGVLKGRGLKVAAHLIFGLPGEGRTEILQTVSLVAGLGVDGVKIHNLHVPHGTPMARELLKGELAVPGPWSHLEHVIAALERLPAAVVIMRLVCETPADRLAAPRGFWPKGVFTARLAAEMRRRGAYQGRLVGASAGGSSPSGRLSQPIA